MKARIMNKTIEIPDERLAKGKRGGEHAGKSCDPKDVGEMVQASKPDHARRQNGLNQIRMATSSPSREVKTVIGAAGSNPAPSPLIFVLKGQMKSGKNRVLITRTGHRYSPKEFQVWRQEMIDQIGLVEHVLTGPVSLIVDYVPGDLIKRDVDGMLSALFHVIVKAGILLDDAQVKNVQWYQWPLNREQPQCRVTIEVLS